MRPRETTDEELAMYREAAVEYRPYVRKLLRRLGVPARDIDDYTQELLLRGVPLAFKTFNPWRSGKLSGQIAQAVSGYVYHQRKTAAHRRELLRREFAHRWREVSAEHHWCGLNTEPRPGQELERAEWLTWLLGLLTPLQYNYIVMHHLYGVPQHEIAEMYGVVHQAVNRTIRNGFDRLRYRIMEKEV